MGRNIFKSLSVMLCLMCSVMGYAQSYTYELEGFEDSAWGKAAATVVSSTGKWTTNKNIQSTEQSLEGNYSLKISKKAGIITPELTSGAGALVYYAKVQNRQVNVDVSVDGENWKTVEDYKETSEWTKHTVNIMDADVRYVKIYTTSNNQVYIDNIVLTGYPEGTLATVVTGEASDISCSSATVIGTITDSGDKEIIECGVCWSINAEPTINDNVVKASPDNFTVRLSGMPCDATIYYCAYAHSMAGVAYGEVKTFKTQAAKVPVITVGKPVEDESLGDEQHIFVKISAEITDDGGVAPTEVGVCYNTTGNPTVDDNTVTTYLNGSTFMKSIPLQPQTTYYLRAYAKNIAGVGYSEEMTYTTPELIIPEYAHNKYYVSTDGDDATADGSEAKPFYSLQRAVDKVVAGDTIFMQAGTYNYNARINIGTIGRRNSGMIVVKSQNGRAILDFSSMACADNNQGIRLTGSYWHFYGIDICGAGDNGMLIERNKPSGGNYNDIKNKTDEGHDNIIENCRFYRNRDTGLQMKNLAENNKVINCDSYFNADPDHGDADGYAVKISHGTGNYFYGCRAWNNSDDGWDGFIKKEGNFPDDVTTTMENCWAFRNGFLEDETEGKGNGNGFKLGSNQGNNNVILNRCLAFDNLQKGFDQNHNTGNMIFNNCTGYSAKYTSNSSHYTYRVEEPVASGHEVRFTNCVAISDGIADRNKSEYAPYNISSDARMITCDFNTLPSDYQSIDPSEMTKERDAQGNLPVLPFMRIADGNAKLIDRGTAVIPYPGESNASVGILYNGTAPDLGCFETEDINTAIGGLLTNAIGTVEKLMITRTIGGLLVVTVPTELTSSSRTIIVTDISGRLITTGTFYGNTTAVETTDYKKPLVISVMANGKRYTSKIKRGF